MHLGYATRAGFAEATGFAPRTLGDLEKCRRQSYDRTTFARLEKALNWEPGKVQQILEDQVPNDASPTEDSSGSAPELLEAKRARAAQISRDIARDDFVLTWLLTHSGIEGADLLRLELYVRRRREEQSRELLAELEPRIRMLGGDVIYPWDEDLTLEPPAT